MNVIKLQHEISEEQYHAICQFLDTMNIKVELLPQVEMPFNYDLERMKEHVENQEFVEVPDWALESDEDFDKWMKSV